MRQATLRWPTEDRGEKRDSNKEREQREEIQKEQSKDEATWVRGGKEDDNQRYRDFLKYCEEKRGNKNWR